MALEEAREMMVGTRPIIALHEPQLGTLGRGDLKVVNPLPMLFCRHNKYLK